MEAMSLRISINSDSDCDSDPDTDPDPEGCFGLPRFVRLAQAMPFRCDRLQQNDFSGCAGSHTGLPALACGLDLGGTVTRIAAGHGRIIGKDNSDAYLLIGRIGD